MGKLITLLFLITLTFVSLLVSCAQERGKIKFDLMQSEWFLNEKDSSKRLPAKIPGSVHMDLFANKEISDPFYRNNEKELQWIGEKDWIYSTNFTVPAELLTMDNIELQFNGLDTYADVYLNDSLVVKADNFFREWKINAKQFIKKEHNNLEIEFASALRRSKDKKKQSDIPLDIIYPFTRKPAYHFGWDWGPVFVTSGIWKTIEVESWNNARLLDLQIIQDKLSDERAELTFIYKIEADKEIEVSLNTRCLNTGGSGRQNYKLTKGINLIKSDFFIDQPERWWSNGLGNSYLYNFKSELLIGSSVVDRIEERIGLRTIKLIQKPDSLGKSFYFELNGIPVFIKGANYIPQDMFLNRPTEDDYQTIIKNTVDANMNMLRVWGGGFYENDIFYDLCDKNGILVWQDFMFACALYPGDEDFLNNVKEEAIQNVIRLRNHPSIALWCGNNENYVGWRDWGWTNNLSTEDSIKLWNDYEKLFHQLLPEIITEYDGDRFYWPSSPLQGWGYPVNTEGDVHYWGIWHGQQPFEYFQQEQRIGRFVSEYGFQGCPELSTIKKFTIAEDRDINSEVMLAHQKHRIGYPVINKYMEWYYNKPKDFEAYLYVSQVQQAYGIGMAIETYRRAMSVCMGTLYWQLNDCYPVTSWSGIDSYGKWKALHYRTSDLYKKILVSPLVKDNRLQVYVVSDNLNPLKAKLDLGLYDLKGKLLKKISKDLIVQPNISKIYYNAAIDDFLQENSKNEVILVSKIIHNKEILAENNFLIDVPKNIILSKAKITYRSEQIENGFELTFISDVFAKDVFLSTEDGIGFFSKNFFDIIPGIPVKSNLLIDKKDFNINKDILIYSLVDSYQ